MKVNSVIIVLAAPLVIFASVATLGGVLQNIQDTQVSTIDPGFVPSTGQLNLGYTPQLPSTAVAREISSPADARAAYFASQRPTSALGPDVTTGAASLEADGAAPIGATVQTEPAKFSTINDTLDRVPTTAWPLGLSDQQRERIYQAVMTDQTAPATDTGNLERTSELPTEVALNGMHALPASLDDIAQVRGLEYVKTRDKVFLVRPANRIVVDAIGR